MAGAKPLILACFLLSGALCSDYTVKIPKHLQALSGSCLLIPCMLISEKNADHLKNSARGIWIKRIPQFAKPEATVVFNSSRPNNKLPGGIVGDLLQKNCTTFLSQIPAGYSDKYYFRIETTRYKKTFPGTPVYIDVIDSPPKPKITQLKELKEGTPVGLKCTAAAPCIRSLPVLTWSHDLGNVLSELQEDSDDSGEANSVSSVLTFTPQRRLHHGKSVVCSAEYTRQNGKTTVEDTITLKVLFPPSDTRASISPSGPLLHGSPVSLTCRSQAYPPVRSFTWFRTTWRQTTPRGSGETLSFNASIDDVGSYYCEARNSQGTQASAHVTLAIEGVSEPLSLPAIGGIVGGMFGVLLICSLLLMFLRLRKSRELCMNMRTTRVEEQSNPSSDPSKAARTWDTTEAVESQQEESHYAEIEFSKQAKQKGKKGMEEGPRQETEYSEVKFSERKALVPIGDIYASVKPKKRPQ
ncbi:sialic acid-binding Ig-like lectin 12 [Conger conger]|uniref:sialic acid-binding Ig-like lectin 12 n=1 Tax=Conger conger TaxID=82655 RepID=UPI002A5A0B88|nr:sialic acid-binding Ig-like lectin 12 [Conger conger]XP_061095279.1 sialic acid-binding Ig-like lectin 12 [Conger conger]